MPYPNDRKSSCTPETSVYIYVFLSLAWTHSFLTQQCYYYICHTADYENNGDLMQDSYIMADKSQRSFKNNFQVRKHCLWSDCPFSNKPLARFRHISSIHMLLQEVLIRNPIIISLTSLQLWNPPLSADRIECLATFSQFEDLLPTASDVLKPDMAFPLSILLCDESKKLY